MREKPRQVSTDMNRQRLEEDLDTYRQTALDLGAAEAKIIATHEIPVEEGVLVKCRIPRCFGYGVCAHCPPHAPRPAELREYLQGYEWAIIFVRYVPTELLLRDRGDAERRAAFRSIYEIVGKIESMAFFDGHYLAFGLGAGSCRSILCGPDKQCLALQGEVCRFPVMARPSMEAVGINVYKMLASAGWAIYPIGRGTQADEVPQATLAGLVVVQ